MRRANMKRSNLAALSVVPGLCAVLAVACSGGHSRGEPEPADPATGATTTEPAPTTGGRLSLKGSDTMVILAQRFADGYMGAHAGTVIEVSGGGSGTGLAALLAGTTDIANSSRSINERETTSLRET